MNTPEDICPDFPEWPESWRGVQKDIPYGQGILNVRVCGGGASMRGEMEDTGATVLSRGIGGRV